MHGPTGIVWANLTPFSLSGHGGAACARYTASALPAELLASLHAGLAAVPVEFNRIVISKREAPVL